MLDSAKDCLRRGFLPIPIPKGQKAPNLTGWQKLRLTATDLPTYFANGHSNIGLLLGEPSGGLTDCDLDSPEARTLSHLLPRTGWISGHRSSRESHYWYITQPDSTIKFQDPGDGSMLLEVRGTGGQTVIPPSIHPSGEMYEWTKYEDPARIDRTKLLAITSHVAALALLARHWPEQGRQDAALALAGGLLRAGWTVERAQETTGHLCAAAGDEEPGKRADAVTYTERALAEKKAVTGWTRLAEVMGGKVVDKAREWLGVNDYRDQATTTQAAPYLIEAGCMCRKKFTKEGPVAEALCNFTAKVSEELIQDDGIETARAFLIDGRLDTGQPLPPAKVPASRFAGMAWVTDA